MSIEFRYLKNDGFPTWWDCDPYLHYVKQIMHRLRADQQSMVSASRFVLDRETSFWHSSLKSLEFAQPGALELRFLSDNGERSFAFSYFGVARVNSEFPTMRFLPSLIVQELVLLPLGMYRHVFSDLGGSKVEVIAKDVRFSESFLH